jgi:four helix bundle protein
MAAIKRFKDLDIWQKARVYSRNIFRVANHEKFSHDYRLREQIKASSGSVMDNIAEGFERSGNKEFIQYLYIANGSCGESRSQLYRALDYEYLLQKDFDALMQEALDLSQNISNFIKYMKSSEMKGSKYNS